MRLAGATRQAPTWGVVGGLFSEGAGREKTSQKWMTKPHRSSEASREFRFGFRVWSLASLVVAGCTGAIDVPSHGRGPGDGPGGTGGPLVCRPAAPPTPLRRLTANEYRATIEDLFGEVDDVTRGFMRDERVGPFRSNVSAPVAELAVERYLEAAEGVAAAVAPRLSELLSCDPEDAEGCERALLDRLGRRVYRRPLEPEERARYEAMLLEHRSGGFVHAARIVVQTMLQSPHFLYHVEGVEPSDEGGVARLDAFAIAERLAYFLWRSSPDDALLDAAERGALLTDSGLREQARRLLESPRASETIATFHEEWLGLLDLDRVAFEILDPSIDAELRAAIVDEPRRFIRHVFENDDGRFPTLLTAPYTVGPAALATFYGAAEAPGEGFVALDPDARAGLLTQASVLAVHRSPVLRGKLVREEFFCQHVLPPPPGVDTTPPEPDPNESMRDQWIRHSNDPACKGCHVLMDPIGFGFLHFDTVGRYRDHYGAFPVDASGELRGTTDADGAFEGVPELAGRLASSAQVHRCIAEKWLKFALGRALGRAGESSDPCFVEEVHAKFAASDYDVRLLLEAVATHPYFVHVLVESP